MSLVFIIGGIVVIIGMTLAFLATSFINAAYGFREAQRAEAVAASGAYDAILRLTRNKDLSGVYALPIDGLSASVTVSPDVPSAGFVTIVSNSSVSGRFRSVESVVSRDAVSGQISLISWRAAL